MNLRLYDYLVLLLFELFLLLHIYDSLLFPVDLLPWRLFNHRIASTLIVVSHLQNML